MEKKLDIAILQPAADLDVRTVTRVRSAIDELIDGGCRRMILNMASVEYVDSAGMALLFRSIRRMRDCGGLISLTQVNDVVMKSLRIARVVDFVSISDRAKKSEVPALDPSQSPLWRSSLSLSEKSFAECRRSVERLLARLDLSEDALFDVGLAAGEAMGNAIDHSCCTAAMVEVLAYPDRVLIEVSDNGCGFSVEENESKQEAQEAGQPYLERGRGIKLMRMLCDAVDIAPGQHGLGTKVCLTKLLN